MAGRDYYDLFPEDREDDGSEQPVLWDVDPEDVIEPAPTPAVVIHERMPDPAEEPRDLGDEDWRPPDWAYEDAAKRRNESAAPRQRPVTGPVARGGPDCLDELIPEKYWGQTWALVPGQPAVSRFPPMRDDPQGPVTQTFIDFQEHGHRVSREKHPEWYCVECRAVQAVALCPDCKVCSNHPTGDPRTERGTPYLCKQCGLVFMAAMVCQPCRKKMIERFGGQLALPEPVVRERKSTSKRRRPREVEEAMIPGLD